MGPKLSALIVDDEEGARKLLNGLLSDMQCFTEIRTAKSSSTAYNELMQFDPDIVFLDIRMPGKDGFDFMNELPADKKRPEIVIVTAYDEYGIKAVKNKAFDYLLKPVDRKELKLCIMKFIEARTLKKAEDPPVIKVNPEKPSRIRINIRSGTIFVNPSSILYCKADGNYTTICTGEKIHLCSMNLGKVRELLPEECFIRLGRSHIINEEFITMLDRRESSITLEREGQLVKVRIPRHHLKDLDKICR